MYGLWTRAPGEQKMCRLGMNARTVEKLCLRVLQPRLSDLHIYFSTTGYQISLFLHLYLFSVLLIISGLSGSLSLRHSELDVFPPMANLLFPPQVNIQCRLETSSIMMLQTHDPLLHMIQPPIHQVNLNISCIIQHWPLPWLYPTSEIRPLYREHLRIYTEVNTC